MQELNECQNRSVATEEEHRQDIDTLKEMNLAVKTQVDVPCCEPELKNSTAVAFPSPQHVAAPWQLTAQW